MRLDGETILDTGMKLARDGGRVTMRQIGAALEVDPTAIYRHFRNKDEFLRALLDRLMQLVLDETRATPDEWRDYLHEFAERTVDTFARYPAIASEAIRIGTNGSAESATMESILRAFRAAGLTGEHLVDHYGAYSGFVLTFSTSAIHMGSDGQWTPSNPSVNAADHPLVSENWPGLSRLTGAEVRRLGIDTILDSAERHAARARAAD